MSDKPIQAAKDAAKTYIKGRVEKAIEQGQGICSAEMRDMIEDPKMREIMARLGKDVAEDVAKTRLPGIGAFTMTEKVSQRAFDKMQAGDTLGAMGDYAAVVAIGATSWIPFGGDATITYLRDNGVQLDPAPVVNAVNTVTATGLICKVLDAEARIKAHTDKGLKPKDEDMALIDKADLSKDERAAVMKAVGRAVKAYQEHQAEEQKLGQLPSPNTPMTAGKSIDPHARH